MRTAKAANDGTGNALPDFMSVKPFQSAGLIAGRSALRPADLPAVIQPRGGFVMGISRTAARAGVCTVPPQGSAPATKSLQSGHSEKIEAHTSFDFSVII